MTEEMRKRLEEDAEKYADNVATTEERGWMDRSDIYAIAKDAHLAGVECGYKEAIAQAKEWWKDHYKLPDYYHSETRDVQEKMRDDYEFHMKVVDDFETDMNKLWEEKK